MDTQNNQDNQANKNNNKTFIIIICALVAIIIVMAATMSKSQSKNGASNEQEGSGVEEKEIEIASGPQLVEIEIDEKDEAADALEENGESEERTYEQEYFKISPSTQTDYSNALDPTSYEMYKSHINSDFKFSYAPALYNDVVWDNSRINHDFGLQMDYVRFTGTDGSSLEAGLYYRQDTLSIKKCAQYFNNLAQQEIAEAVVLKNDIKKKSAIIITSGYRSGQVVYDIVYIDPEYIMKYTLYTPYPRENELRNMYGYVTECCYRLCLFAGSNERVRSYEEYLSY